MKPLYPIKRSKQATVARIKVTAERVEIVAPVGMSEACLQQWILAKHDWIETAQQKLRGKVSAVRSVSPESYKDGVLLPFEGEYYPLSIVSTPLKRSKVDFNERFTVWMPEHISATLSSDYIKMALSQWLKGAVKLRVLSFVALHGTRHQLFPRTVRIKTQKSRWGSCGSANDININWLLVLAPLEILEYVVVHELCHIRIRNHSADFWALVAEHLPDYQQRRNWLKLNGATLTV